MNKNSNIYNFFIKNKILYTFNENKKYHPILTSGLHSDTYFNSIKLLESPALTQMTLKYLFDSFSMLENIAETCNSIGGILTLGSHLAYIITETYTHFRSKQRIIFNKKDSKILSYWNINSDIKEPILLVDDVITTGNSIKYVVDNLQKNVKISPYIIVIVNRYGKNEIILSGIKFKILSALSLKCKTWTKDKCPLCNKYKSIPLRPKANWNKFFI